MVRISGEIYFSFAKIFLFPSISIFPGIPYVHLSSPMPYLYRSHKSIPRGVSNRRAALSWIKSNNIKEGVLYFGDDDNTFDLRLFSEIRYTKRVSMFPVGLIGDYSVSSPIVKEVSSLSNSFYIL